MPVEELLEELVCELLDVLVCELLGVPELCENRLSPFKKRGRPYKDLTRCSGGAARPTGRHVSFAARPASSQEATSCGSAERRRPLPMTGFAMSCVRFVYRTHVPWSPPRICSEKPMQAAI